jgi:hypothetical protein
VRTAVGASGGAGDVGIAVGALVLNYEYDGTQVSREDAVCYIANRAEKRGRRTVNVGTVYLELDPTTSEPYWFPLGRQLAQHLSVPTLADAFTMLLTASPDDRLRMMADRQIQPHDIREARQLLRLAQEDETELTNILDSFVPEAGDKGECGRCDTEASAQAKAGGVSAHTPESDGDTDKKENETPEEPQEPSKPAPKTPPAVDFASVEIVDGVPGARRASPSPRNETDNTAALAAPAGSVALWNLRARWTLGTAGGQIA